MANVEFAKRTTVVSTALGTTSYVDLAVVIGSAAISVAIFSMLAAFGAAAGLSAASPFTGSGLSATAIGVATALWILWISISSFVAGGYIAGRLVRRVHDSSDHECNIRDGAHGLMVWAVTALAMAWIATSTAGSVARGATAAGAGIVQKLQEAADPVAYTSNKLWRSTSPTAQPTAEDRQASTAILAATAVNGSMPADDQSYLTSQIAAKTGVPQQEAAKRVEDAKSEVLAGAQKAKQAANTARKVGVLVAFLTACSLAIGAAAAWWAAAAGGKHRDDNVELSDLWVWR